MDSCKCSPVQYGRLVRRFGSTGAHRLCAVASAVGYLALGLSPANFASLASLRLISAVFKHTQTLQRAQLAGAKLDDENARIRLLGAHSTLSSLGFIVGPLIGGLALDIGGFRLVAGLACSGFLGLALLTSSPLGSGEGDEASVGRDRPSDDVTSSPSTGPSASLQLLSVADLLALQLPMSLAAQLFRHNFSLALHFRFKASPSAAGLATSLGAVSGLLSGLAVGPLQSASGLGPDGLVLLAVFGQAACLSVASSGLAASLAQFCAAQAPLSFCNGLARDAYPSLMRRRLLSTASPASVADAMAASQSVNSLARLLAPLLGGAVESVLGGDAASSQLAAALIAVCLACPLAAAGPLTAGLRRRLWLRLRPMQHSADRKMR